MRIRLLYFVPSFNIKTEVCNWYLPNMASSIIIFWFNIFNVCIRCIWLNATYIMINFFRNILQFDRAIGPTLLHHKWSLIWRFIFVCRMIIYHEFISNFIVVVNLFYIFADVIFIDLRLPSLAYYFPIHLMFYQDNHITAKY